MKIITQDYGSGTSSSILDYRIKDVVLVSPEKYEHVFDVQDDLFFVGHDFLFFLWDTKEKLERWKNNKFRKVVWCFERIDAIIPSWKQKSEYSLSILKQFVDQIYVCDEDDADKYGDWMPQWASPKFYEMKDIDIKIDKYLFSGQAGKPEYQARTFLLNNIFQDIDIKDKFQYTNFSRDMSWDVYCKNLLNFSGVLNPIGILKAFNTRTYETMYSGRILLQQTAGKYKRHEKLLEGNQNVVLFETLDELKIKIKDYNFSKKNSKPCEFFEKNNIHARFKDIGVDIK